MRVLELEVGIILSTHENCYQLWKNLHYGISSSSCFFLHKHANWNKHVNKHVNIKHLNLCIEKNTCFNAHFSWNPQKVFPSFHENYNTPLEHTPGNPPGQLWKESLHYSLLVKVWGCVPKVLWNNLRKVFPNLGFLFLITIKSTPQKIRPPSGRGVGFPTGRVGCFERYPLLASKRNSRRGESALKNVSGSRVVMMKYQPKQCPQITTDLHLFDPSRYG